MHPNESVKEKKKMHNSKASLYLMELMISILFFAISSSVCIQLFVKSHLVNKDTTMRTHAVLNVQNTAEYFWASNGDVEKTMSYYAEYSEDQNLYSVFYDKNFQPCGEANASYIEKIHFTEDAKYSYAEIGIYESAKKDALYTLKVKKYIMGGNAHEKE